MFSNKNLFCRTCSGFALILQDSFMNCESFRHTIQHFFRHRSWYWFVHWFLIDFGSRIGKINPAAFIFGRKVVIHFEFILIHFGHRRARFLHLLGPSSSQNHSKWNRNDERQSNVMTKQQQRNDQTPKRRTKQRRIETKGTRTKQRTTKRRNGNTAKGRTRKRRNDAALR